jgi:hypothetical protein
VTEPELPTGAGIGWLSAEPMISRWLAVEPVNNLSLKGELLLQAAVEAAMQRTITTFETVGDRNAGTRLRIAQLAKLGN